MRLILAFVLICFQGTAWGDIYRYTDEEGVECFTDSPVTTKAAVFMRDKSSIRRITPGRLGKAATATIDPVLQVDGRVTSLVGLRHDPIDGALRHHQGVDIAIPEGTPIKPVAPGVVVFGGTRQGYGNTVIVEHSDGLVTLYAHNSYIQVAAGESVGTDTVIALSGSTGRSTGPHLHFEAWQDGKNVTNAILDRRMSLPPRSETHLAGGGTVIRRVQQADGTLFFTNLPITRHSN